LPGRPVFDIQQNAAPDVRIELVVLEPSGVARVVGRTSLDGDSVKKRLRLWLDDTDLATKQAYGVMPPPTVDDDEGGFVIELVAPPGSYERLRLEFQGEEPVVLLDTALDSFTVSAPDYGELFTRSQPLRRTDVYGSGPPVAAVSGDVLAMTRWLTGDTLDFGCGAGALVACLRQNGLQAWGLERRSPVIEGALLVEASPYVELYDGMFPSPFVNERFESVTCIEVIEHIEDYEAAAAELARLTRDKLLLTTPDLSAIPLLHRHQIVPWHLLEATHVSLFTQKSLTRLLERYFSVVEIWRIGPVNINGTLFHTSLLARCRKVSSVTGLA
jgi:SAM-dependent methyltransferase